MFNVAVINVKDLIKYLVGLIISALLIIILTRYFSAEKINNFKKSIINYNYKLNTFVKNSYIEALNKNIPAISEINKIEKVGNKTEEKSQSINLYKMFLNVEISEINQENKDVKIESESNSNEIKIQNEKSKEQNMKEQKTDVSTEVVTTNPIISVPTDTYGKVQIRNQTGYILNEDILAPNIELNNKNIIIFHTHTCESYTPTEQNKYEASGTYRTTNLEYSVAKVGDELTNNLTNFGYSVIHDKTLHDYPAYTGSYARSLKTIETIRKSNDADVIIDLHRDAIGSNSSYAPTVKIGDDYAAQLMFVIGTDGGGLWHPNWSQNLKFAIKVQEKAEELYPGLFKPIIVRNSRYNQHVAKAATIIEVGATGNTLEQSLTSMKYLSKVISEVVK